MFFPSQPYFAHALQKRWLKLNILLISTFFCKWSGQIKKPKSPYIYTNMSPKNMHVPKSPPFLSLQLPFSWFSACTQNFSVYKRHTQDFGPCILPNKREINKFSYYNRIKISLRSCRNKASRTIGINSPQQATVLRRWDGHLKIGSYRWAKVLRLYIICLWRNWFLVGQWKWLAGKKSLFCHYHWW